MRRPMSRDGRSQGLIRRVHGAVRHWLRKPPPVSDMTLAGNVRTKLAMLTRHAHLIDVTVARGLVTLQGPIVADEIDYLPKIIAHIPGVQRVRSRLTVYKEDAEIERSYKTRSGIPALQDTTSGPPPTAPPMEVADGLQPAGSRHPKTRLFMMAAGIAILSGGMVVNLMARSGIHITRLRDRVKRLAPQQDRPMSLDPNEPGAGPTNPRQELRK